MPPYEDDRGRCVSNQKLDCFSSKEILLLRFVDLKTTEGLISQTPDCGTTKWTSINTLHDGAAPQSKGAKQEVHRRAHHLAKVAGAGDFLSQVSQRTKRVNQFLCGRLHALVDHWGSFKSGEIRKRFAFIFREHNMTGKAQHFEQLDGLIVDVGKNDAGATLFSDVNNSEED